MSGGGIQLLRVAAVAAPVEKHALTLEETVEALGSHSLVQELRDIEALKPAGRRRKALLFSAAAVARVWEEFAAGKYDGQLKTWRSSNG